MSWRWVVSFMIWPLYACPPKEIVTNTHWIGGWVGPSPFFAPAANWNLVTILIASLLHRSLAIVFWVQDILGNSFKEKQGAWKREWKRRGRDKQWTDNTQSQSCAPQVHRFTRGGRVLRLQTAPQGSQPLPPASLKYKIVITNLKKANKYSVVCVLQKTKQEKIWMSKVQCGVVCWNCQNCNVRLCFYPCFRVCHTKLKSWNQHLTGKSRLHNCKYYFSLYADSLNTNILFYTTR